MAGKFSKYADNALLNHVFGTTTFTSPTTVYLALSTTIPDANDGNITEPVDMGYARMAIAFTTSTARSLTNSARINFANATGNWGSITGYVLYDALTGGNPLGTGSFTTPMTVNSGDACSVFASTVTVSVPTGGASTYLANALLNHTFTHSAYSVPTKYLACSTANPTDDASGKVEPTGNSYARIATGTFATSTAKATDNSATIELAPATGSWSTITHTCIMDALTDGNMLAYGALTVPQAVTANVILQMPIGNLDITLV